MKMPSSLSTGNDLLNRVHDAISSSKIRAVPTCQLECLDLTTLLHKVLNEVFLVIEGHRHVVGGVYVRHRNFTSCSVLDRLIHALRIPACKSAEVLVDLLHVVVWPLARARRSNRLARHKNGEGRQRYVHPL